MKINQEYHACECGYQKKYCKCPDVSESTGTAGCRHCGSTDGYCVKYTSKGETQFSWEGEPENDINLDVIYQKRKRCINCGKTN